MADVVVLVITRHCKRAPRFGVGELWHVREGGLSCPEESAISIDRGREVSGTYIGGFPEPERAMRGAPEALRVLRGRLDCFIVLW